MLTITLKNGTVLKTEAVTDTAYMPFASIFMDEKEAGLPDFNDPKIAARIMRNLGDPIFVKRLAFGIVTLFPDVPETLAWFDHPTKKPSFGIAGLSIEDITQIAVSAGNALNPQQTGFRPTKPRRR